MLQPRNHYHSCMPSIGPCFGQQFYDTQHQDHTHVHLTLPPLSPMLKPHIHHPRPHRLPFTHPLSCCMLFTPLAPLMMHLTPLVPLMMHLPYTRRLRVDSHSIGIVFYITHPSALNNTNGSCPLNLAMMNPLTAVGPVRPVTNRLPWRFWTADGSDESAMNV